MTELDVMKSSAYAEVLDQPGNDHRRQQVAEWLEKLWPDRARLIRLQLASARLAKRALTEAVPDGSDRKRSYDLLKQMCGALEQPVRSLGWILDWDFVRGFVGLVELNGRTFLDRGEELFSHFPVRHLILNDCADLIVEIAASPYLERLVGLSIRRQKLGDAEALLLAQSPHVRNLRWLDLMSNRIGLDGFESLAWSPNLAALVHVNLHSNAAPNPTAELGHDWTGAVVCLDRPPRTSEEFERKYGYKRWLHGAELIPEYPPSYDAFDGDDPV